MKNTNKLIKSAIASILTITATSALITAVNAAETQKCYGIVKSGMNDCATATAACAGSSTRDNQSDAYILLPKGTCNKIVGGSLSPK